MIDDGISLQDEPSGIGGGLLKPSPTTPLPDMSPFFLRQYVKVCFVMQEGQC